MVQLADLQEIENSLREPFAVLDEICLINQEKVLNAMQSVRLASENISDTVPMATDFVNDRNLFFLTVQGESMIDVGILDGDQVLIEPTSSAREGEIILALIEDEATIKTFYRDEVNRRFRLQPENSTMDPIYVDDLKILGRVIGLYRLF